MNTLDRELDLPEYKTFQPELDRLEGNKLSQGTEQRKELASALHEANRQATRPYYIQDQDELATWRPGRIMHVSELMAGIYKLGLNPRLADKGFGGMTGLDIDVPTEHGTRRQYVCAVPAGFMPEYSQIRLGEHGEVENEKYRGWRTVLLRLLEIGATTEAKLAKVFGPPTSVGSGPYLRSLKALRGKA